MANIHQAMKWLKEGKPVRQSSWENPDMYLFIDGRWGPRLDIFGKSNLGPRPNLKEEYTEATDWEIYSKSFPDDDYSLIDLIENKRVESLKKAEKPNAIKLNKKNIEKLTKYQFYNTDSHSEIEMFFDLEIIENNALGDDECIVFEFKEELEEPKPNLECATTNQLADEICARIGIQISELLNYRTVD